MQSSGYPRIDVELIELHTAAVAGGGGVGLELFTGVPGGIIVLFQVLICASISARMTQSAGTGSGLPFSCRQCGKHHRRARFAIGEGRA
jgi:hypothetical protein